LGFQELFVLKLESGVRQQVDRHTDGVQYIKFFTQKYGYFLQHLEKILCRLLAENSSSCSDGCVANAIALWNSLIHSYTTPYQQSQYNNNTSCNTDCNLMPEYIGVIDADFMRGAHFFAGTDRQQGLL